MLKQKLVNNFLLFGLLLPGKVFAASMPDLSTVLQNLEDILNPLADLLIVISFIGGIYFIYTGILELKLFGQPPSQMMRPGELKGPLVHIIIGAVLIYIPTTSDIVTFSLLGDSGKTVFSGGAINIGLAGSASDELLSYAPIPIEQKWHDVMNTIFHYVQFIGLIAFVRGWFILSKVGQHGGQPGTASKGVIHVLGGIIAINIVPVLEILRNTIIG
jgi:intracellular multiplication protein IcmC